MTQPVVFISYSHEDEQEKNQLLSHLGVLQRQDLIDLWSDDRIRPGADWQTELTQTISEAKVAILFITANYLNSDFILDEQIPALLQRQESEGLVVFPIIAKACAWQTVNWLTKMEVRPKNGEPVWRGKESYVDDKLASIATEVANILANEQSQIETIPKPTKSGSTLEESPTISDLPFQNKSDQENNPRIFLCHANEDKSKVQTLYHQLEEAGYRPWLDKADLLPGQDWRREIEKLIRDPYNLVVICISNKSTTKRGVVQQEIKWALDILDQMPDDTIYLIPARLEPCDVPARLSSLHWVDLFEPDGFDKLKQALDFEIQTRQSSKTSIFSELDPTLSTPDTDTILSSHEAAPNDIAQQTAVLEESIPVSLLKNQPFSLTRLGPIAGLPYGTVRLDGNLFELLAEDNGVLIAEVAPGPLNEPNTLEINVELDQVKGVFLLLNTNYGLKSFTGAKPGEGWDEKVIGRLIFQFSDDTHQVQELRLGHHLRDTHVGNQPWGVDQLRSNQSREIWMAPDHSVALDCLKVDILEPKDLQKIIVSAHLEVENPQQVKLGEQPIGFPAIRIYGITCLTYQNRTRND